MKANIPETNKKRVVIIGGGFGGLKLARKLAGTDYQVVLIDKNNYHQFQPLFYQIATSGLEPSAICFPFRKVFQKSKNVYVRITEVTSVNTRENYINSGIGMIKYDFLVLAIGADTNYYGNKNIMEHSLPMKSVTEAMDIRNKVLENYENALITEDKALKNALMNIVIVGGGPTGVEVAGTLANMKKHILPKDYPELDFKEMNISLIETTPKLLNGMSEAASKKAKQYLEKLDVHVLTNTSVKDYNGQQVLLMDGTTIDTKTMVSAAGVISNKLEGIPETALAKNGRIIVDQFNRIQGSDNVFAIGDIALLKEEAYPNGHPQMAQPAIQQAKGVANNLKNIEKGKPLVPFHYKNPGSMATVGKNLAVVDLPYIKFQGFFAWLVWMLVHLMSIVGIKNRVMIFINWAWSYVTYDQSLRLILRAKNKKL